MLNNFLFFSFYCFAFFFYRIEVVSSILVGIMGKIVIRILKNKKKNSDLSVVVENAKLFSLRNEIEFLNDFSKTSF